MTRKPRTDAEHNRRHIVAVARAAFAADGLDLPMREIARRAGLGVATVYRHFPSRPDLIGAVLAEQVAHCVAEMRAALDDPDPWRALCATVRGFSERQLRDRGLNEVLLGSHAAALKFTEERRAQERGLELLVERARSAGAVRPDMSVEDVRVGLLAIASFRALPPGRADAAVRRLANLLLAGLSARERSPASG
ncbi:TetR/AcrR family transcriptional regulator [Sphaerisporangium aureirubrum]|uniref:TetR/AcrR family transcriptional regulator n=1 Tax=Sphaerisporangium aureirubrum TaxID=1544736 RepID=A0ABW1NJD2_9ACTN